MDKGLALEDILREVHKFVMRSKWHTAGPRGQQQNPNDPLPKSQLSYRRASCAAS